jgi:hypothetical protein
VRQNTYGDLQLGEQLKSRWNFGILKSGASGPRKSHVSALTGVSS